MLWTCSLREKGSSQTNTENIGQKNQLLKSISLSHKGNFNRDIYYNMSEDKDDLKIIKVYRFNNTKASWHEFALKFGVIADYRGYSDIIEGIVTPPDEKEDLEILAEDNAATKKSKKEKQLARAANKKGFRDLVMSTDGISLNIVQNAVSDKLTRGDLKEAWGRLERRWNPKTREDKVQFYTKFLHYKLENVRQRPMDWLAFMEKKRNELANTGHINGR